MRAKGATAVVVVSVVVVSVAAATNAMVRRGVLPGPSVLPLRVPRSLDDVRATAALLQRVADSRRAALSAAYLLCYVALQCFSIPGTVFLSVLGGTVFGTPRGFALALSAATVGATCAFGLSRALTNGVVAAWMPQRLAAFRAAFEAHRKTALWWLLFLRLTPVLPNWFINVASPIVGVPVETFVAATFFGVAPATYVCVRAGRMLHEIVSIRDAVTVADVSWMAALAAFSLVPTLRPVQSRISALLSKAEEESPAKD